MGKIILDYLGASSVITYILTRGRQEDQEERRYMDWSRAQKGEKILLSWL